MSPRKKETREQARTRRSLTAKASHLLKKAFPEDYGENRKENKSVKTVKLTLNKLVEIKK